MAFDPEAKLWDVLTGGYNLTDRLLALLGRPLDSRGQEEAMAFSQELSRVFMVSISMLKPAGDSKRALQTAPGTRSGDSFGVCSTRAKAKVISPDGFTSHRNARAEEFTRKEVTSSPHRDGYQWQKYGQKNIQNCSFMRYYFRCHDRRCNAKKKVQQQDGGSTTTLISSSDAPVFEVTYVNDHTCHDVVALAEDSSRSKPPATTTAATGPQSSLKAGETEENTALLDLLRRIGGGGAEEDEAIVSCLATVISGTAPGAGAEEPTRAARNGNGPPASSSYVAAGRHPPSADDGGGGGTADDGAMSMMDHAGFSWDPSSSFWPAGAAGEFEVEVMDLICDDVRMDRDEDARFVDALWPRYYT